MKKTKKKSIYKLINLLIWAILTFSISFNIFMVANFQANCSNIDSRWKADLLYKLWHRSLDWDWDWIACENLPYNE